MIERDTELQITSEPAIAYSTCYRLPFLSLFHADCMGIMKQYPDKYFDLAIVDPPYGIELSMYRPYLKKDRSAEYNKRQLENKKYEQKEWDIKPDKEYFETLFRVSKNQIICGAYMFTDILPISKSWFVWDKKISNEATFSPVDLFWTSFTCGMKNYSKSPLAETRGGKDRIHPTQKPTGLYDFILKQYATEGMKILDTHFGSGSIALAVDKANRLDKMNLHLTACEIDKEYIDKAIKRISESIKQGTLSF